MLSNLFKKWESSIRAYCEDNGLSFDKVQNAVKSCGKNVLFLQYFDENEKVNGLLDETPCPIVLKITQHGNGDLNFQQTKYTQKYLGKAS